MTFLAREKAELPTTSRAVDYSPGDIINWDLGGGITHIGNYRLKSKQRGSNIEIVARQKWSEIRDDPRISFHYGSVVSDDDKLMKE